MAQLREAAGIPVGELEPFVLPERANRLTVRQREVILHMVRVLLNDEDAPAGATTEHNLPEN